MLLFGLFAFFFGSVGVKVAATEVHTCRYQRSATFLLDTMGEVG